jgi:diguanylate cyclase (GGDEF)-like protein/PAS domain S-box-containing protein
MRRLIATEQACSGRESRTAMAAASGFNCSSELDRISIMPHDRQGEASDQPHRRLAAIVESSDDAIFSQNWEGAITSWNSGAERMLGLLAAQAIGQSDARLVPPERENPLPEFRQRIRRGERVEPFETEWKATDGRRVCVSISISPLRIESGDVIGVACIARDITARKEAEARIQHLAYFDALTGLPNRTLFQDRLQQAVALARRQDRMLAVHFLDLDHFKSVNDSQGHAGGDALLRGVADRLQRSIRASDTVARIAGDEFAIIQTDLARTEAAAALAGRVLTAVSAPMVLDHHTVRTTISAGIAIYPQDDPSGGQLLSHADTAMYLAKKRGRNDFAFYSEGTAS